MGSPAILPAFIERFDRSGDSIARFDIESLKKSVSNHLEELFNAKSRLDVADAAGFPLVEESVLNYGNRDFSAPGARELRRTEVADNLLTMIRRFEPRIVPESLRITTIDGAKDDDVLCFELWAEIRLSPFPLGLKLMAKLNLDSERYSVT